MNANPVRNSRSFALIRGKHYTLRTGQGDWRMMP